MAYAVSCRCGRTGTEQLPGTPEVEGAQTKWSQAIVERLLLGQQPFHHANVAASDDELQPRLGCLFFDDLEQDGRQASLCRPQVGQLVDDGEATPVTRIVGRADAGTTQGRGAPVVRHRVPGPLGESGQLVSERTGAGDEDVGFTTVRERSEQPRLPDTTTPIDGQARTPPVFEPVVDRRNSSTRSRKASIRGKTYGALTSDHST